MQDFVELRVVRMFRRIFPRCLQDLAKYLLAALFLSKDRPACKTIPRISILRGRLFVPAMLVDRSMKFAQNLVGKYQSYIVLLLAEPHC
jgi:hypothetical protein